MADPRRTLAGLKESLLSVQESTASDREPVELDQSRVGRLSRMDALQDQAMAQALNDRRDLEIKRIDAALLRLDDGDYGYCTTCGEEIEPRRLELDPAAPQCLVCAS